MATSALGVWTEKQIEEFLIIIGIAEFHSKSLAIALVATNYMPENLLLFNRPDHLEKINTSGCMNKSSNSLP